MVTRTENDTTANPQSTPKQTQFNNTLDYLRNSEGKLITSGENMSFSGSKAIKIIVITKLLKRLILLIKEDRDVLCRYLMERVISMYSLRNLNQ